MHKSKHVVNIFLSGMIFLAAMAAGGCAGPWSLGEVQPVKVTRCPQRPVNIEVLLYRDNTPGPKKINWGDGIINALAVTFTPYPVWPDPNSYERLPGVNELDETIDQWKKKSIGFYSAGRVRRFNMWQWLGVTPLLAKYLDSSGIAQVVYLQGEEFTGDANSFMYPRLSTPKSDIIVRLVLDRYTHGELMVTYGLPLIAGLPIGCAHVGGRSNIVWSFDIVACDASTGDEILRKTYDGYIYKYRAFTYAWYNHFLVYLGPVIHDAFGDFVEELDATLPRADDVAYWDAVAARRKPRSASQVQALPRK